MTRRTSESLRRVRSLNCKYNNAKRFKKPKSLQDQLYYEWQVAQADYFEEQLLSDTCKTFRDRFPIVFEGLLTSVRNLECNSRTKVTVEYPDGTISSVLLQDICRGYCIMSRSENMKLVRDSRIHRQRTQGLTPRELKRQSESGRLGGSHRWIHYEK